MINVQHITCNPFQENGYILYDETKECIIIDPGCYTENEQQQYVDFIEKNELKPVKLVNTHCHLDHICGNNFIAKKYDLRLFAHEKEDFILKASPQTGKMYGFEFDLSPDIDTFLQEDDILTFGDSALEILFTPGHSPGSVSFYSAEDDFIIAGDVLFYLSIGRTDLPGGSHQTLLQSIRQELFTLPASVKVYNGHGQPTNIGFEKENNPFF